MTTIPQSLARRDHAGKAVYSDQEVIALSKRVKDEERIERGFPLRQHCHVRDRRG